MRSHYTISGTTPEWERRGETLVNWKSARAASKVGLGLQDKLLIGKLDAKRDWGYAQELR